MAYKMVIYAIAYRKSLGRATLPGGLEVAVGEEGTHPVHD